MGATAGGTKQEGTSQGCVAHHDKVYSGLTDQEDNYLWVCRACGKEGKSPNPMQPDLYLATVQKHRALKEAGNLKPGLIYLHNILKVQAIVTAVGIKNETCFVEFSPHGQPIGMSSRVTMTIHEFLKAFTLYQPAKDPTMV